MLTFGATLCTPARWSRGSRQLISRLIQSYWSTSHPGDTWLANPWLFVSRHLPIGSYFYVMSSELTFHEATDFHAGPLPEGLRWSRSVRHDAVRAQVFAIARDCTRLESGRPQFCWRTK